MRKSKVKMPEEKKIQCQKVIHTAATASATAGALPIPMSDTIPISAAQIVMVIGIGKIFDFEVSQAVAKTIVGVGLAQQAGRAVFSNILKCVPGAGSVLGGFVGGTTAAAVTEALGWLVADDFYRMSQGEEPENIIESADSLQGLFKR